MHLCTWYGYEQYIYMYMYRNRCSWRLFVSLSEIFPTTHPHWCFMRMLQLTSMMVSFYIAVMSGWKLAIIWQVMNSYQGIFKCYEFKKFQVSVSIWNSQTKQEKFVISQLLNIEEFAICSPEFILYLTDLITNILIFFF